MYPGFLNQQSSTVGSACDERIRLIKSTSLHISKTNMLNFFTIQHSVSVSLSVYYLYNVHGEMNVLLKSLFSLIYSFLELFSQKVKKIDIPCIWCQIQHQSQQTGSSNLHSMLLELQPPENPKRL